MSDALPAADQVRLEELLDRAALDAETARRARLKPFLDSAPEHAVSPAVGQAVQSEWLTSIGRSHVLRTRIRNREAE